MTSPIRLQDFDVTPERGFLCTYDAGTVRLPSLLDPVVETAAHLPRLLPTGRLRSFLEKLPALDLTTFIASASEEQLRTAMVRYSFLVQAYVWGERQPPATLPRPLAVPIWQLAKRLGQKPLLPYSAYVLDNWALIDNTRGIGLDNIYMIQPFLSGVDEAWFVLVHVAIEATAGAALAEIPVLVGAAEARDLGAARASFERMLAVWGRINAIFDRMPEQCDPYVYFNRVRPYIHGWQDNPALPNGLIYEGVAETGGRGQVFRGQTGSQSSIVPAMDALFGLGHAADPLRHFLDELHEYRPPAHRKLIDAVRARSALRAFISGARDSAAAKLYNACVLEVAKFRTRHLEYAASYIARQSKNAAGNDTEVGTGGTPFMKYLKKHRDETEAQLLPE